MRSGLEQVGGEGLAWLAIGIGVLGMPLAGIATADPTAEGRGVLLGLLGLVLAAMTSSSDGIVVRADRPTEHEPRWHEYDGSSRGL
jgi:uncharacterized membrane protein